MLTFGICFILFINLKKAAENVFQREAFDN